MWCRSGVPSGTSLPLPSRSPPDLDPCLPAMPCRHDTGRTHREDRTVNIGQAAERSGLPAKTIRYYEQIGLIEKPARRTSNYRDYDETDVQMLVFIQRARSLGFSIDDCRDLLALYRA